MLKKFVIVKHIGDNGKFLFRVPKGIVLDAGDKVVCDTARGNDQLAVCCCDTFLADPNVVMPLFGVNESRMKFVTGKIEYEMFDTAREEEEEEDGEDGQQNSWESF